jgi:hypothetical protein
MGIIEIENAEEWLVIGPTTPMRLVAVIVPTAFCEGVRIREIKIVLRGWCSSSLPA